MVSVDFPLRIQVRRGHRLWSPIFQQSQLVQRQVQDTIHPRQFHLCLVFRRRFEPTRRPSLNMDILCDIPRLLHLRCIRLISVLPLLSRVSRARRRKRACRMHRRRRRVILYNQVKASRGLCLGVKGIKMKVDGNLGLLDGRKQGSLSTVVVNDVDRWECKQCLRRPDVFGDL
jgi:hypothetical protein